MKLICHTIEDLPDVAKRIYDYGRDRTIWLLKGEMGSGKTTFVTTLSRIIGTTDHVNSPSYAIVNEYRSTQGEKLYHFDFFRARDVDEIFDIGFEEYVDSGDLCLIEWPELIENFLPEKHLIIHIKIPDRETRIFNVTKK
ncbi:MAG: tRNA (adenosine(37)-N6)-threonylcarbamoyltransferase complex ATPase subunit type 1 TsaE [Cyclobacteriaceae bacterium]|nr:tRNA (adenosine(37)-N6)-threonylcarbamoyltransferase complex ATPase subunit type 1 TsaE [Cyclobacteriaceae bacterium]